MVYSDTTSLSGIIQHIERIADLGQTYISGDATRLKEFTATINRVQHRVWHSIFLYNGNWQYDDGSYTDLPSSKTDLVIGQRKYSLPTDALTVHRVEILDENDNWSVLKPITKELVGEGLDDFLNGNGSPEYYRLVGDTIEIFPASDYAQSLSMRVYYDRDSVDFAYDDTTETPGFASPYHEILPIKACIEWLKIKQPTSPTLQLLLQDELRLDKEIKEFYSRRFKSLRPRITRTKQCYA